MDLDKISDSNLQRKDQIHINNEAENNRFKVNQDKAIVKDPITITEHFIKLNDDFKVKLISF
jgi:hypothetical protein